MQRSRLWTEMAWTDFRSADMASVIAVLPIAAVEQHGPHLPTGVDAQIMDLYLRRVCERLPDSAEVLFLPIQTIGVSPEHADFPGTLTLSPATALACWTDLGESVFRAGCRKLIFLSSHGGNHAVAETVARDLRARRGLFCVTASWRRFGYPDGLFDPTELTHGIHGGDIETSLMLAARPDLVRVSELSHFESANVGFERDFTWLRAGAPIPFGWMAQDLHESGAVGDATRAAAAKGEAAADYGATAFIELLQDVEAFDLARLGQGAID